VCRRVMPWTRVARQGKQYTARAASVLVFLRDLRLFLRDLSGKSFFASRLDKRDLPEQNSLRRIKSENASDGSSPGAP
jgi:hypothetical protein